jgi:hypothetical protein
MSVGAHCTGRGAEGERPVVRRKVRAARFGIEWLLPEERLRWQRVLARETPLP